MTTPMFLPPPPTSTIQIKHLRHSHRNSRHRHLNQTYSNFGAVTATELNTSSFGTSTTKTLLPAIDGPVNSRDKYEQLL
ncbi:Protein of unknown function [Pyronema omphalodes CBS 100304]|uniref:Uncharacterized protein n=1 Tax=Pyronema omphalodes (strain CBS 100304) TaxID=1076935 RepID=U4LFK5_PYROM|nr:Protein of unknown function [Pyronema omphalodes CBS 100304]